MGQIRQETKALSYGDYKEHFLTNCQYAFSRNYNGQSVFVTVNNSDNHFTINLPSQNAEEYVGGISGERVAVNDGCICINVKANSGEIWLPLGLTDGKAEPIEIVVEEKTHKATVGEEIKMPEPVKENVKVQANPNKSYEEMTIEELQKAILERMSKNGPVTEQMKKDVYENVYHDSLVTWIKSFN